MSEARKFPHHLIREIFEQPDALRRTIEPRVSLTDGLVHLNEVRISREELLAEFHQGLDDAAERVRAFASADLEQPRGVGKKQLPTSVGGLLVHLADHTQRHTGQIVSITKVLKASR